MVEKVMVAAISIGLDKEIRGTCRNVLLGFCKTEPGQYLVEHAQRVYDSFCAIGDYEGGTVNIWAEFENMNDAMMYVMRYGND
jgi:hypothetical protein